MLQPAWRGGRACHWPPWSTSQRRGGSCYPPPVPPPPLLAAIIAHQAEANHWHLSSCFLPSFPPSLLLISLPFLVLAVLWSQARPSGERSGSSIHPAGKSGNPKCMCSRIWQCAQQLPSPHTHFSPLALFPTLGLPAISMVEESLQACQFPSPSLLHTLYFRHYKESGWGPMRYMVTWE